MDLNLHHRKLFAGLFLPAVFLAAACGTVAENVRRPVRTTELTAHSPRPSVIDVEHYSISLRLMPEQRALEADCTIRFRPTASGLQTVSLDLEGLSVYSVRDQAGTALEFRHAGGVLDIDLAGMPAAGTSTELTIAYGGQPAKGLWFAGDRAGVSTHVFTQGETEDSRWWFPCWDAPSDRATSELRVTMPAEWVSVAAGEKVERRDLGNGYATEHWRMNFDHPCYLVTLVAGEFVVQQDMWRSVPLLYLSEPQYAPYLETVFARTGSALDFLSELTGLDYPYPKYSQACVDNFPFGGMENISATTMTDTILTDERGRRDKSADGLIIHEAAHQWFGDLITCRDWSHIWLNESFATYSEWLYWESADGPDAFRARVREGQDDYLSQDVGGDRRPHVWNVYRDPIDLFVSGGQAYPGGASRLHLLRFVLGDEDFFGGLRRYVSDHAGSSVVTSDFQRSMEAVSGEDLTPFFEQWLYQPGYPEFRVEWTWDDLASNVVVRVEQVQATAHHTPYVFEAPVDIEVLTRKGPQVHRLYIDERREAFEIACDEEPVWVRFDKNGWLPKRLESVKRAQEWLQIASRDDDVNGRYDAVRALGKLAAEERDPENKRLYVAEIVSRLRTDPIELVRTASAAALGMAGGAEARANLELAARSDASAPVRTAALDALHRWGPDPILGEFAREVYAQQYSWKTMGAAAGLVVAADPDNAFGWLTRQMFTEAPHDVLQGYLLERLAKLDRDGVEEQLLRWARDESLAQGARAVAVKELARLTRGSSRTARELTPLLDEPGFRLRRSVLEALGSYADIGTQKALEAYYERSVFPRERRIIEGALGL